jgi:hypothetical protein
VFAQKRVSYLSAHSASKNGAATATNFSGERRLTNTWDGDPGECWLTVTGVLRIAMRERWVQIDTGGCPHEIVYSVFYSIVYSVDFFWYRSY